MIMLLAFLVFMTLPAFAAEVSHLSVAVVEFDPSRFTIKGSREHLAAMTNDIETYGGTIHEVTVLGWADVDYPLRERPYTVEETALADARAKVTGMIFEERLPGKVKYWNMAKEANLVDRIMGEPASVAKDFLKRPPPAPPKAGQLSHILKHGGPGRVLVLVRWHADAERVDSLLYVAKKP